MSKQQRVIEDLYGGKLTSEFHDMKLHVGDTLM